MSAAYRREQDGHSDTHRFPQRTCTPERVVGAGEAGQHLTGRGIDPLGGAAQRMGRTQFLTRASASAQAPKSFDTSRATTSRDISGDRSSSFRLPRSESSSSVSVPAAIAVGRRAGLERQKSPRSRSPPQRVCRAASANPRREAPSLGV